MSRPPVVLAILDGYGVAPKNDGNAIELAKKPFIDSLVKDYPVVTLQASGEAAGLSWGEVGNSQVGHLTIGTGRILYQPLPRIDKSVADKSFFDNKALTEAVEHIKKTGGNLHFIGCLSPGGVHSHQNHLFALIDLAKKLKVSKDKCFTHAIMDGRDMPFDSGKDFIKQLREVVKSTGGLGEIASVSGRFYGMDRDSHWERTEASYLAMTGKSSHVANDPLKALLESYKKQVYDEQVEPFMIVDKDNTPIGAIEDNDSVVFFNFRSDRARQLTQAFVLPSFSKFNRPFIKKLFFATMTEYEKGLPVVVAYEPYQPKNVLAEVVSKAGLKQIHIAETEKYAHVTYFFNGGREEPFNGEDRQLVASPKVPSYDKKPEMSAKELTKKAIKGLEKYDFLVVNYANPDLVAHTGNLKATIQAIEFVDHCLKELCEAVLTVNGTMIITADHGNAEGLKNLKTGEIDKEHSATPVPCFFVKKEWKGKALPIQDAGPDLADAPPAGFLADIAPTIISIMGLEQPKEMTGVSLIG
ncbi:MAG: 2,3-bisphosphoglycerate-independent phosphoglycerate mutase [bacterium]